MNKKVYSLIHVIIIIIITAIISGITTGVLLTKNSMNHLGINYGNLVADENIKTFLNTYNEVVSDYYQDVDRKEMINSAIAGMMNYLNEPYTTYLDDNNTDILYNQLNGTYEGIGISILGNKIVSVVLNSPAEKAGILADDILILINDVDVTEMAASEITKLIKESEGEVKISVQRGEEILSFNVKAETLDMPSTEYKMFDNKIGYIRMDTFATNLPKEVNIILDRLEKQGMEKLIIDVRNDSGGYLDKAFEVSSIFVEKDKIIYSLLDKNNNKTDYKDTDDNNTSYPIVVLTNEATASAAEILTAALKDSYGAITVGKKTFGKGKVQHAYRLSTGGMVKYTSSNWLTPSGICIDEIGITPDFEVENEIIYDEEEKEIIEIIDNQLDKALELLSK